MEPSTNDDRALRGLKLLLLSKGAKGLGRESAVSGLSIEGGCGPGKVYVSLCSRLWICSVLFFSLCASLNRAIPIGYPGRERGNGDPMIRPDLNVSDIDVTAHGGMFANK